MYFAYKLKFFFLLLLTVYEGQKNAIHFIKGIWQLEKKLYTDAQDLRGLPKIGRIPECKTSVGEVHLWLSSQDNTYPFLYFCGVGGVHRHGRGSIFKNRVDIWDDLKSYMVQFEC